MMNPYVSKQTLYKSIELVRKELKISNSAFPLNLINICNNRNDVTIEYLSFKTKGMHGIAIKSNDDNSQDIILLDGKQSLKEQNFYCGHELIHLMLHRNSHTNTFSCYEKVLPKQDTFLEWQANEGSAELLVPYKEIIPMYVTLCKKYPKDFLHTQIDEILSKHFGVTISVIQNRINGLQYEIYQYYNGINIDNIDIISATKQKEKGIHNLSAEQTICCNCLHPIHKVHKFCTICRTPNNFFGLYKGLINMKYKHKFKVTPEDKLLECPRCNNEEIENTFCRICGAELINRCSGQHDNEFEKCDAILPLNARYCSNCGSTSTFYNNNLLKSWNFNNDNELPF